VNENDDGEFLYVDPTNEVYDALDLNRGVETTFFSPAIPWTFGNRVLKGEPMFSEELLGVLGKWKNAIYVPPKQDQAFFQGGAFVFDEDNNNGGGETLYAHYDEATAGHAVPNEMVNRAIEVAKAKKAAKAVEAAEAAAATTNENAVATAENETDAALVRG